MMLEVKLLAQGKKKVLTENIDELKIYKWAGNWFVPSVAFLETINTTRGLGDIFFLWMSRN